MEIYLDRTYPQHKPKSHPWLFRRIRNVAGGYRMYHIGSVPVAVTFDANLLCLCPQLETDLCRAAGRRLGSIYEGWAPLRLTDEDRATLADMLLRRGTDG